MLVEIAAMETWAARTIIVEQSRWPLTPGAQGQTRHLSQTCEPKAYRACPRD